MKVSIIIPTLNEEEGIAKVLCLIPPELNAQVLVVDSSKDTTPLIAQRLGATVIRIRGGKGKAMQVGVEHAKGDVLVFMDGDASYDPRFIPKLFKRLANANLVLGCRGVRKFSKDDLPRSVYQLGNHLWNLFFHSAGIKLKEPLTGFRALRKRDWERLKLKSKGFEIEAEMNFRAIEEGFKIAEVPVPNLRRKGKSKFLTNPKAWLKVIKLIRKKSKPRFYRNLGRQAPSLQRKI